MMKRIFTIGFLLTALISLICSCKGERKSWLVKTEKKTSTDDRPVAESATYTYDRSGRLLAVDYGTPAWKMTVTYDHDTVLESFPAQGNKFDHRCVLNSNGLMAKDNLSENTYDSDGFLIRSQKQDGSIRTYTISNGDIISTANQNDPVVKGSSEMTYYPEPDKRDYGVAYRGRHSTHLVKSDKYTTPNGSYTNEHTYTFDDKGRVLTMTEVEIVNAQKHFTTTTTYTYYE